MNKVKLYGKIDKTNKNNIKWAHLNPGRSVTFESFWQVSWLMVHRSLTPSQRLLRKWHIIEQKVAHHSQWPVRSGFSPDSFLILCLQAEEPKRPVFNFQVTTSSQTAKSLYIFANQTKNFNYYFNDRNQISCYYNKFIQ